MSSLDVGAVEARAAVVVVHAKKRPPRHLTARIAVAWIVALLVGVVLASLLPAADPSSNDYGNLSASPALGHLFGTDNLGRDVFARTLHGGTLVAADRGDRGARWQS